MKRRTWIVVGSLTGFLAVPALVAVAAVLVRYLRGPVFGDLAAAAMFIAGAAGILIGGFVASRVSRAAPRRLATFGAVCGAILGAAVMGSLFLAVEVTGDDWPHGLAAFVTGGIIGASVGGLLGGFIGFGQVDSRTLDRGHTVRAG